MLFIKGPKMNDLVVADRAAEWRRLKALVLDSVSSPITRRVYNLGLDEFFAWYAQEPRPGFTKATVAAWRVALEARGLGAVSINVRITAVRKLAVEAADNGLLAPEIASGITRVKGVASKGVHLGNWLTVRQAQTLLNTPDATTAKGLRDRAILAVLFGLRPASVRGGRAHRLAPRPPRSGTGGGASPISLESIGPSARCQCRRGSRSRSTLGPPRPASPMGHVFRAVNRGGQVQSTALSEKVVWQLFQGYTASAGVP